MKDYAIIASAYQSSVRIYVSQTTNLVEEARSIHQTLPTATAALGRFLTASVMMGLMYKGKETITLKIESNGPISKMVAEANALGEVRGTINNPNVYIKYEDGPKKGKLNVGAAIGEGFLHVTKDLGMREMFSSSAHLQTGEIADDFTYFFVASEQTPTSVGLGVLVNQDQSVLASGGYILQLLPGCSEDIISKIEKTIASLPPISRMIAEGQTPEKILSQLASGTEKILDQKPLKYHCSSTKETFAKSLSTLNKETLKEMLDEDGQIEIECHFCGKKYLFNKTEIEDLIKNKEATQN